MFSNDDDDDFSASGGSSKLASLFDMGKNQAGNQSLMYNAPKQPKKSNQQTSTETNAQSARLAVIIAVAVHAYKFENGSHVSQGKLGAAILGDNDTRTYKLLLYKGQQQHVTISMITLNFSFIIQANNYGSFYDSNRVSWSLNFENEAIITNFAKQVCIAKANSCATLDTLVFQDLVVGDGETIENDDFVDIKFTANFLTDFKIGTLFESNATSDKFLRVKVGQGKVIQGLEDSLIGMKKNGKRYAVISPLLGYAKRKTENPALKTANLIYEIHVIKFHKENASIRSSSPLLVDHDKDVTGRFQQSFSSNDDVNVRARGASLSEQLSQSPDKKKATIISRIVKMGQPMIPLQGAIVAQTSDSECEDDMISATGSPPISENEASVSSEHAKPIPKPRPIHSQPTQQQQQQQQPTIVQHQTIPQAVSVYQPQLSYQPIPFQHVSAPQYGMFQQPSFSPTPVPSQVVLNSENQMLLADNRGQILEMRLQMSKMGEKLDNVLSKLDQTSHLSVHSISSVDTAQLSYSIQKVIADNDKLKAEVAEKTARIEGQNEKISDLLQKNHKYIEQSHEFLELRSNSMQINTVQTQAKLNTLEQEKLQLSTELTEASAKLTVAENNYKRSEQIIKEFKEQTEVLKKEVESHNLLTDNLQNQIKALQGQREDLESLLDGANAEKALKDSELEQLRKLITDRNTKRDENVETLKMKYEEGLAKLNKELSKVQQDEKPNESTNIVSEVKRIMNGVYRKLQGEFEPDFEYAGRDVCRVIKDTVLTVTLKLVEKFEPDVDALNSAIPNVESVNLSKIDDAIDSENHGSLQKLDSGKQVLDSDIELEGSKSSPVAGSWKPEPPPPPYYRVDDDEDDDDWLK